MDFCRKESLIILFTNLKTPCETTYTILSIVSTSKNFTLNFF